MLQGVRTDVLLLKGRVLQSLMTSYTVIRHLCLIGVKAGARCCKVSGLTCDYKTAGPSFPFDGAMAEARCDSGDLAVGEFVTNSVHSSTRR